MGMARSSGGKSRELIVQNLLLAKLYKDGFIKKTGEGYDFDMSLNIEKKYGYDQQETCADIREVMRRVLVGLRKTGTKVTVKAIFPGQSLEEGFSNPTEEAVPAEGPR